MSESQQGSAQTTTAPDPLKAGVGWLAKHWPRLRLGHEGFMLEKIQRQARIAEVTARNSMTGRMDDTTGWPEDGDDGMGVMIGDHIENHYHLPAEQPPKEAAPVADSAAEKQEPFLLRKAAPLLMALALGSAGAGGAGLGIWLNLLLNVPETPPPAVQEQELPDYPTPPGYGLSL